ncbi:enoyl-CoA hydratase-related protein [Pseudooceanicola sp.]|uniref:enoyl-CoA hydratase/isomerase family protein n=1 Tax=Pseudooceanicola sp. TaxID=1914328 RepID=UPI0026386E05|nr:enoyl-CoA hydratase-related protein [Pseudooceanicola sp.]MDF1856817.1 enoyl-CoA hydratase-related protein [Pseudooceanicola sp.]
MPELIEHSADGVLTLTLNRPRRHNALSPEIRVRLLELLVEERNTLRHRVIVVTGAGGSFCSGADLDLSEILPRRATIEGTMKTGINQIVALLREIPVPVIAAVDGAAAGAGFGLALAADFMVVSERARFHLAFTRIAASPDAGVMAQLTYKIGAARAASLAMLGETLTAEDAAQLGFAYKVTAPDKLTAETNALAARLAQGPTVSYGNVKRLVNALCPAGDTRYLALEAECQAKAFATADFEEGVTAFSEKRTAVFEGK